MGGASPESGSDTSASQPYWAQLGGPGAKRIPGRSTASATGAVTAVSYQSLRYQTPESPLAAKGGSGLAEMVGFIDSSPASGSGVPPATSEYMGGSSSSLETLSDTSVIRVSAGWSIVDRGRKSVTSKLARLVMIGVEPCTVPVFLAGLRPKEREVLCLANKLDIVAQPNRQWRLDVYCRLDQYANILALLRKLAYQRDYQRPKPFAGYKERKEGNGSDGPANGGPKGMPTRSVSHGAFISWNVRGVKGNRLCLEGLLDKLRPSVLALQETLWDRKNGPLHFAGYSVFGRPTKNKNRGNALVVAESLAAYPVDLRSEYLVGAKVSMGDAMWLLISAYLPSGGNFRGQRNAAMKEIRKVFKEELEKDRNARVVVMGDFNMPKADAIKRVAKWNLELTVVENRGADWTRRAKSGKLAALDFFIASSGATGGSPKAEVLRQWKGFSDHFPVRYHARVGHFEKDQIKSKYIRDPPSEIAQKFNASNRWEPLTHISVQESPTELNEATARFVETCHKVAEEVGLRSLVSSGKGRIRLNKREMRAVKSYRKAFSDLRRSPLSDEIQTKYAEAKARLKILNNSLDGKRKAAEARKVTKLAKEGSERQLFRAVREVCSASKAATIGALRSNGHLVFGPQKVAEAMGHHYSSLACADSNDSRAIGNGDWSAMIDPREVLTELSEINVDLTWAEVKDALKGCDNNKATGPDGIPTEVLKLALNESESPDSPFAKAFFALMQDQFHHGRVGGISENLATVRSLYKKGDVLDPGNYRGISLMSTVTKVTATIVAARITSALTSAGRLVETQAGFRPKEEGLAHVIALYEIVRRRANEGHSTWALFVDFMKAFDSVDHEALFAKCEAIGIRGRSMRYIRELYANSYASAKVGDSTSVPFKVGRGVRQGCPLSPILFNIFVNDLFAAARSSRLGVTTQGLTEPCPGLQFADDTVLLGSSLKDLRASARALEEWTDKWKLSVNVGKCGLMVFNGEAKIWAELADSVSFGGLAVPVVDSYTYLGVGIHKSFGFSGQARLDLHHAIKLRQLAGQKKLMSLRRLLTNHRVPVAIRVKVVNSCLTPVLTYGGEWFGMHSQTEVLDRILVTAAKWILGSRAKSPMMSKESLFAGLGIDSASFRCSSLRARAYLKYQTLDTVVGGLLSVTFKGKPKTWQTWTSWYLKTYLKLEIDLEDRSPSTNFTQELKAWHCKGQKKVKARNVPLSETQVRNLQELLLWLPSGHRGEVLLYRYFLDGLWDHQKRVDAKLGASLAGRLGCCSACRETLGGISEWDHVILRCATYNAERRDYLSGWALGFGGSTALDVRRHIADQVLEGLSGPTHRSSDPVDNSEGGMKGRATKALALALFLSRVAPVHLNRVFDGEIRGLRPNVYLSASCSE